MQMLKTVLIAILFVTFDVPVTSCSERNTVTETIKINADDRPTSMPMNCGCKSADRFNSFGLYSKRQADHQCIKEDIFVQSSKSRECPNSRNRDVGDAQDNKYSNIGSLSAEKVDVTGDKNTARPYTSTVGAPKNSQNSDILINELVLIPEGTFTMGTDKPILPRDGEGPARKVSLGTFYISKYAISNSAFEEFVHHTRHETEVSCLSVECMVNGWTECYHKSKAMF